MGFHTRLLLALVALVAMTTASVAFALDRWLVSDLVHRLDERLQAQALGVAEWLRTARHPDRLAERLAQVVNARVTIIDAQGKVVGDAAPGGSTLMSTQGQGNARELHYVTAPAPGGFSIRLGVSLADVRAMQRTMRMRILWISLGAFVFALIVATIVSRALTNRLRIMKQSAVALAAGRYDVQLPTGGRDEIGALGRALTSMARQLEARIADLTRERDRRRDFLGDVSHELRTPVATIQGCAETLLSEQLTPEVQREFLESAHRHATRMGRIVGDLMQLAELETRPPDRIVREPVHVGPLARQVARALADRAGARRQRIAVNADDSLVAVGEAIGVEQIIENLLDNAIRHSVEGGEIRIAVTAADGAVLLEVADDGPGIATEHHQRIFERLYRVDRTRSRAHGGAGLGLAIVKELAESMDGRVWLESEVSQGSRFFVRLPRRASADSRRTASGDYSPVTTM